MARRNGGFVGQDGLDAPDPPTGITPTAGSASVSVAFTAPSDAGTSAITGFVAQVSTDDTAYSAGSNTGTSSPIIVSSLTNDTAATAKVWAINAYGTSAPSDASASFTPAPPRGLFGLQTINGSASNTISYVTLTTTGNVTDFGDLTTVRTNGAACSSTTRGVFMGGGSNVMDYVTIASTGNATDFGDIYFAPTQNGSFSNKTRGLTFGGGGTNTLSYITIASAGDTTDFGDLSAATIKASGLASPTRGLRVGGNSSGITNRMEYVTIANTGNVTDFGDMTIKTEELAACSSETRGLMGGGLELAGDGSNVWTDVVGYITIASTGNATDFGDLSSGRRQLGSTSSNLRGLFAGGQQGPSGYAKINTIDYFTIATLGNSTDFGNMTGTNIHSSGCSSDHGGLQ